MSDPNKKRLGQMLMMGSTVVLVVYVCGIGITNYFRYNKFKLEYHNAQEKYVDLKEKNQEFRRQVQAFNSTDYWELEAKRRLGYCRVGEIQYYVIDPQGDPKK